MASAPAPIFVLHLSAAGGILVIALEMSKGILEGTMDQIEKRLERVTQSLLENEALTEGLDDEPAQALLDWAIACAEMIVRDSAALSKARMDSRLRATRQLVRRVRRWVQQSQKTQLGFGAKGKLLRRLFSWVAAQQQANAETLDKIIQTAQDVYVDFKPPSDEQCAAFLQRWPELAQDPVQMIAELRQLVEGASRVSIKSGGRNDEKIH